MVIDRTTISATGDRMGGKVDRVEWCRMLKSSVACAVELGLRALSDSLDAWSSFSATST